MIKSKLETFFKKDRPKPRVIYAVTAGAFLGELLIYAEEQNNAYNFLALPEMNIRVIPKDKFKFGIQNSILEIVEKLPRSVYKICYKQYKKNKATALSNNA